MEKTVTISGVSKSFGSITALDEINLEVGRGELFGLIGPDGSGKTTLFRILVTLLLADRGTVTMAGWDVVRDFRKIRRIVGYMPGRFSLYQDLSVEENLRFFARTFNTTVEENSRLIRPVYSQIEPFKDRPAGKLSGGMKQKLALSCALVHRPEILVLDEPTTGVDAVSRKEFWEMLKTLGNEGITTLVSTPYMDEASQCGRVALIQDGKILDTDTPSGITGKFRWTLLTVRAGDMHRLPGALREYPGAVSAHRFGDSVHLALDEKQQDTAATAVRAFLLERKFEDVAAEPVRPGIEDCFMDLMGRS